MEYNHEKIRLIKQYETICELIAIRKKEINDYLVQAELKWKLAEQLKEECVELQSNNMEIDLI